MTMLDTGIYGAKVQSWRRSNPRELLKRLIEESPAADETALLAAFRELLRGEASQEFLDSIIEYWFANNYRSLVQHPGTRAPAGAAQAVQQAHVAEIKEKVKAHIRKEARMLLLDMVLPNGKPLRDCTGKECARLGRKIGAWLTNVANKLKPAELVGDVLSEEQVRQLFDSRRAAA